MTRKVATYEFRQLAGFITRKEIFDHLIEVGPKIDGIKYANSVFKSMH